MQTSPPPTPLNTRQKEQEECFQGKIFFKINFTLFSRTLTFPPISFSRQSTFKSYGLVYFYPIPSILLPR